MLVILRIIFGAALWYMIVEVRENAQLHPDTGDLANAGYLAICVTLGLLNAIVWAPFVGARISEPITRTLTGGAFIDHKNRFLQLIRWCERRGYRRIALFLCFLEGVRQPWMPTAFILGFNNSKPRSWFENIYAREVFRFNSTQNCVLAYDALKRHGINPRPHPNPEVELALLALERHVRLEPDKLVLPPAPQITSLQRNPRIRIFEMEIPSERTGPFAQSAPAATGPEDPRTTVIAEAAIDPESLKQQL
ncbi:MAG: hypothetical protein ABI651_06960 [Verrucomicrobiota bacterium]